jgi:hypothetical protein
MSRGICTRIIVHRKDDKTMSLYEKWQDAGSDFDDQGAYDTYWRAYFEKEKDAYDKILSAKQTTLAGTVKELAQTYNMTTLEIVGFFDGINSSLKSPVELESLTDDSEVTAEIDFEKLLFNMHAAKADWLYELPVWADIFDDEKRKEIRKSYMASKTIVKETKVGRNDPCICGSGKKYKKCCAQQ